MSNLKKSLKTSKKQPMQDNWKNVVLYAFFVLVFVIIMSSMFSPLRRAEQIPISQALQEMRDGQVKKISVEGNKLTLDYSGGVEKIAYKDQTDIYEILEKAEIPVGAVTVDVKDSSSKDVWWNLFFSLLPVLIIAGMFFMIFRQAKESQGSLFSFGQSRARLFNKDQPQTKFSDVAGVDEAKHELEEVVEFLKTPEKFRALGARVPKGVLLVGPAGVGKTLLAKAVAGEAGVSFFSVAGSEFMEMLVGVGASRVRDLFATAKKNGPAIIFIDEIDAIGRQRGTGISGGHDEREQTLNQILVEMDGFAPNDNVIVLAATNRPDMLDKALLRPGRFDRIVSLDMPDLAGRVEIIKIHAKGKPLASNVKLEDLAKRTVGFSGADLENTLNEAAIIAARGNKSQIEEQDLEEAALKVKMGPARKRMQSEKDRRMTAYHEAGHAVVMWAMPLLDPVSRVSIVSRGMALGFTAILPQQDRYNETKSRLMQTIAGMLGGRAAEQLVYNELTVGASNDLERANSIARDMVTMYGMSSLGPISTEKRGAYGYNDFESERYSDELMARIDAEVQKILSECERLAMHALQKYRNGLDAVAEELMKIETLDADRFRVMMKEITGVDRVVEESA
jgi:cell division protease FtsH